MNTENKLKIDDFTKALAECINQAQCAVVDPMAHAEIWKEELLELAKGKMPVSEDLEEEVIKKVLYFSVNFHKAPWAIDSTGAVMPIWYAKFGANWKEQQFEKNRLKHCNNITNEQAELEQGFVDQHLDKYQRIPTFLDAIEYGMRLQKEQMMTNAIDGEITFDYYGDDDKTYGCIAHDSFCLEDLGLKDTDKVKMIIIKEG